jgi:hypothetical protein
VFSSVQQCEILHLLSSHPYPTPHQFPSPQSIDDRSQTMLLEHYPSVGFCSNPICYESGSDYQPANC